MLGRDDEWVAVHERAHRLHLEASAFERAAFSAFWIGFSFALRGDVGQASGGRRLGAGQRLLGDLDPFEVLDQGARDQSDHALGEEGLVDDTAAKGSDRCEIAP